MAGLKIPGGEEPLGGGEGGVRQRAHQVAGGGRRQVGRERCVRGAAVPFWLRVSFDVGVCINQTQNEALSSLRGYFKFMGNLNSVSEFCIIGHPASQSFD